MGFTHAKWFAAFRFSINYILWFHTWQCIWYRERFNKAVGLCQRHVCHCYGMHCPTFATSHKWREITGKGMPLVTAKTGARTMDFARRNLKQRIAPFDSYLYNMQVKMFSPIKTQHTDLLLLNFSRFFLHTFWATFNCTYKNKYKKWNFPFLSNDCFRVSVKQHPWMLSMLTSEVFSVHAPCSNPVNVLWRQGTFLNLESNHTNAQLCVHYGQNENLQ